MLFYLKLARTMVVWGITKIGERHYLFNRLVNRWVGEVDPKNVPKCVVFDK
jgi:hypothetical protein